MATIEWLPKDILRKLLKDYMDYEAAVMCLMSLSCFRRCLTSVQIDKYHKDLKEHKRYTNLKKHAMEEYDNHTDRCELCNGRFKHKNYAKHMIRRHIKKSGVKTHEGIPKQIEYCFPRKDNCEVCGTQYPRFDHLDPTRVNFYFDQFCPMEKTRCGLLYDSRNPTIIIRRLCQRDYRYVFRSNRHMCSFEMECIECHHKWSRLSVDECEKCYYNTTRKLLGFIAMPFVFVAAGVMTCMLLESR